MMLTMKITIISVIIVVNLIVIYFVVGNYFFNYALNAKNKKEFLENNPNLVSNKEFDTYIKMAKQLDQKFIESNKPSEIKTVSNDKLKLNLSAYLYQNGNINHKWVIVVHGYDGKANGMIKWIRRFYEKGYNVLAPDLRGHGKSEGDYIGMGWHDRLDMLLWIDKIIEMDPDAEIALFGVSMGGATVMMTSGENLPSNVKVIVEDCGYTSVSEVFIYQLNDLFGLPEFPVIKATDTVAKLRAGYGFYEASAIQQVTKSKTPILFIHGDKDTFVPFEMLDKVYDAATVEKEKLIIEGAGHVDAESVNPHLYWSSIWNFIGRYIN